MCLRKNKKLKKILSASVWVLVRKHAAPVCSIRKILILRQNLCSQMWRICYIAFRTATQQDRNNILCENVKLYSSTSLHPSLQKIQLPIQLFQEWQCTIHATILPSSGKVWGFHWLNRSTTHPQEASLAVFSAYTNEWVYEVENSLIFTSLICTNHTKLKNLCFYSFQIIHFAELKSHRNEKPLF